MENKYYVTLITVSLESKINVFGSDSKESKPAPDPALSQ